MPASGGAAVTLPAQPDTQQQAEQTKAPAAAEFAGQAQLSPVEGPSRQNREFAATQEAQQPISQSQQGAVHQAATPPQGLSLHQAAVQTGIPVSVERGESRSHRSSGKKRKHREEKKEKSYKKKQKKEKNQRSSGELTVDAMHLLIENIMHVWGTLCQACCLTPDMLTLMLHAGRHTRKKSKQKETSLPDEDELSSDSDRS